MGFFEDENKIEFEREKSISMPSLEKKSSSGDDFIMLPTGRGNLRSKEPTMCDSAVNALSSGANGHLETLRDKLQVKSDHKLDNLPSSPAGSVEICERGELMSTKLLDESAKHLYERMTLTGSVLEAAMCANQIGRLLRLKLDVKRAVRERVK